MSAPTVLCQVPKANDSPPMKDCVDARNYVVHKPHTWFREGRPQWKFHCDGVLPVDEQPPCQFYISPEQPECGEPSPTYIRVRVQPGPAQVTVDVCKKHKAAYDQAAAEMRNARRQAKQNLRRAS